MEKLTFGQRLIYYRKQANLLQKELAERAGLTPTALNYYEKDKREPDVAKIKALSEALGISGSELLGISNVAKICSDQLEDKNNLNLTTHEVDLVESYRANPELQPAVDKLLNIEQKSELVFRAANSTDKRPPRMVEMSAERLKRLDEAEEATEI